MPKNNSNINNNNNNNNGKSNINKKYISNIEKILRPSSINIYNQDDLWTSLVGEGGSYIYYNKNIMISSGYREPYKKLNIEKYLEYLKKEWNTGLCIGSTGYSYCSRIMGTFTTNGEKGCFYKHTGWYLEAKKILEHIKNIIPNIDNLEFEYSPQGTIENHGIIYENIEKTIKEFNDILEIEKYESGLFDNYKSRKLKTKKEDKGTRIEGSNKDGKAITYIINNSVVCEDIDEIAYMITDKNIIKLGIREYYSRFYYNNYSNKNTIRSNNKMEKMSEENMEEYTQQNRLDYSIDEDWSESKVTGEDDLWKE